MSDDTDICDDPGCAVCVDDGPGTGAGQRLRREAVADHLRRGYGSGEPTRSGGEGGWLR